MYTYAVIKTGGKQYVVYKGMKLIVEKINVVDNKQEVMINDVLLLFNNDETIIGNPIIKSATVIARIVSQKRAKKVLVFKKKPKKGYKKLIGHRQYLTELEIIRIVN
jgi:large subunit ribosomal protein L21